MSSSSTNTAPLTLEKLRSRYVQDGRIRAFEVFSHDPTRAHLSASKMNILFTGDALQNDSIFLQNFLFNTDYRPSAPVSLIAMIRARETYRRILVRICDGNFLMWTSDCNQALYLYDKRPSVSSSASRSTSSSSSSTTTRRSTTTTNTNTSSRPSQVSHQTSRKPSSEPIPTTTQLKSLFSVPDIK